MKRNVFIAMATVGIAVILSSCSSTYRLEASKVLNNANMASYSTFTIVPYDKTPAEGQSWKTKMTEMDYNNIANGIRAEMIKRGYREDPNAMLLIDFGIYFERNANVSTSVYPSGLYYFGRYRGPFIWSPYWRDSYYRAYTTTKINKEGMLVMDMIDVQRDVHIFSSQVSTTISKNEWLKETADIQKACEMLFKKYPVKPAK